ncbi:MAG: divalent metal cation transporter [Planctomycetaceae bacterium]
MTAPTDETARIERDRATITDARSRGLFAKLGAYTKLSGPGWLQGAITLGGGSLAGSLYLGIIGGYEMMWLQPLMMIFGIVMLSAIAYVALSTQRSPFHEINTHISPVLGWGWAIATLMANLVWAMPQFSLGTAAMQQNLGLVPDTTREWFGVNEGQWACVAILFAVCYLVVWFYDSGGWGVKAFEVLLKVMVAVIVVSFFAVVIAMTTGSAGLPWGEIFTGFVPNPSLLFEPAESLAPLVAQSSDPDYWRGVIVSAQRDRMVAAAATAVGINMTFLLPYSMLKRRWDRDFRGLATFDLATGLFIPFLLATSCVVIAAASQFHGKIEPGLLDPAKATPQSKKLEGDYQKRLNGVLANIHGDKFGKRTDAQQQADRDALKLEDKTIAATLIKRDAHALADSLQELAGKGIAQYVFGIGVLGMAVSTIIILMLINGFTICEILGRPSRGFLHRFGCLLPGVTGGFGFLYLWTGKAKFYLAVPTSRFGMVLLPIAYVAFLLLMNNRRVLGEEMPRGGKRWGINLLMSVAVALALIGAGMSILNDTAVLPPIRIEGVRVRDVALGLLGGLIALAVAVHFLRKPRSRDA